MTDRFVSEPIHPVTSALDTTRMSIGEPGLPRKFRWREKVITIDQVLRQWHETKKCRNGSIEAYVRKHWYKIKTEDNAIMKIYFDRQPDSGRRDMGWWLFSIQKPDMKK